jgi:DegV family protein with EDD domain
MANYQIITDSACDLPQVMLSQLDVIITPLHVLYKGQHMADTVENGPVHDFYAGMRSGEVPTTSAVNPDGWSKVIEPVVAQGKDALVLAFSSGLSTTYQSAVIAATELAEKYPQRKILVVDTLSAALGQGLLVWHTCKKRDEGLSLEQLAAWVEENRQHVAHWFTVDDLVYLKRGGRVSAATAVLGTMLQIKPVLHVDESGHLVSMVKARGRRASMDTLVKKFDELGAGFDNRTVFICHADAMADAQKLEQMMLQRGVEQVFIGNLGAVIGSHAGPGTLALFFLGKHR